MFIQRHLSEKLNLLYKKYPVIFLTGPRQSGKTTLVRHLFNDLDYLRLEDPDIQLNATNDPRGFLSQYEKGVILDEVQRVPRLFSYIQGIVDDRKKSGQYILSGSQNFLLLDKISQTLAGRAAVLKLLPLSFSELSQSMNLKENYSELIWRGFYPALYDKEIIPGDFYPHYIQTYIERDLNQIKNIKDLNRFVIFLKLCAARIGQIFNSSAVGSECGVSTNTIRDWISILEASYTIYFLQPYYKNFKKRLIRSPKLYFHDTGLACSLLNIQSFEQLNLHYLKGAFFENFIINEFIKSAYNKGESPDLWYWKDNHDREIDLIIEKTNSQIAIEIKSGRTIQPDFYKNLSYWYEISGNKPENGYIIYGGDINMRDTKGNILSWKSMDNLIKLA